MKILSYLIAFLLPMGLAAQISTFPYTEDFQGALIPATDLPAGWAESGLATDSIWNTGDAATASSAFFTFPANTLFAYTNDDDCNCDKSEDRLITPVFDFTGLTGAQIDFDYFTGTSGSDFVEIEISTDSGATFTPIDTLAKVASWTNIIIDLSAYTGVGFDKVAVSIKYNDNGIWGYGVGVDNIIVGAPPACPIPTALNTAGLSFNSADVAWTENGTATQWQIEYDTAGFTQGTGTRVIANSNPFSITGLSAETDYEWYVRAICGPADTSLWSAQGSFTTLCAPILAPWTDDVELHNPTTSLSTSLCWTATANNGTNDWNIDGAGSTPSTGTGPAAANSGTNYFYFEASGGTAGNEAYLQTPLIDLTPLTVPQLSFFYHMYGAQNGVMADLYVDVWNGTNYVLVDSIIGEQQANQADPFAQRIIDLSAFSGVIGVRFTASWNGAQWGDISLDDFSIIETPSCPNPTLLVADSISTDSALLDWTENGTATNWEIEYGPAGFPQGSGTSVVTTTKPYPLLGLSPATGYDFYVRSICGPADTSAWAGPNSFATSIQGPQGFTCITGNPSVVFVDDFEAPNGWTGDIGTGGTVSNWNYDANGTGSTGTGPNSAHSGTQYVFVETSGAAVGDTVSFISPAIDLSGGNDFAEMSFWVHAIGAQIGTLDVGVGTSATGPFTNLFSNSGAIQANQADPFVNVGINLDTYVGQTIYIRFNYITNGSFEGDLAIDLLEVSTCTSCSTPTAPTAVSAGLTSADLAWVENGTATNWEIEYGVAPLTPGSGTKVVATTNPYTLSGLTSNTTYDFYVRSICGPADTSNLSLSGSFNTAIGIPFTEDWETTPYTWTNTASVNPQWLYGGSTSSTSTGPAADHTTGTGTFAFLETSTPSSLGDTDTLISAEIITGANDSLLELSFWYHMWGASMGDLQAWVVGAVNGPTLVTTISGQQQLNQADPWLNFADLVTGYENDTVRVVFVGVAGSSFNSDMAVDDISLDLPPANNLGVTVVSAPTSGCGLSATETVTVTIRNFGSAAQTGFSVGYDLNGTPITPETFSGTINPGASATYNFTTTANLATPGDYNVRAYTQLAGDANTGNDDAQVDINSVALASLPYAESFETGTANWFVTGGNTSWDHGAPNGFLINTASDGDSAWVTDLNTNYGDNEFGAVNSPCFDLSSVTNPWITFDIWYDIESLWDGALMQYSTDGGASWNVLGQLNDPYNWYNDTADVIAAQGIDPTGQSWTGDGTQSVPGSNGWVNAKHDIGFLIGQSSVRFRLLFVSDAATVAQGMAFDNVRVFDSIPQVPYYPVGVINTVDANGVADSLNVRVRTSGTVVGVDLDGNNGLSFTIIDMSTSSQEGINIFNFNDVSNYVVNEGDSIMVIGDIDQFNGLQEVFVDSIMVIKSNAFIPQPRLVTSLDESTESNLIEVQDLVLLDASGSGSYNMDATNGTDTMIIRVDADTDVNDSLNINGWNVGDTICSIIGIGGQFDGSNPFTSGYQIFPMRFSDIDTTSCQVTSIAELNGEDAFLNIYPNPTNDMVTIQANRLSTSSARLMVRDINGKIIFEDRLNSNSGYSETLDFSDRANGIYFITIIDGDNLIHKKLIKN